MGSFSGLPFYGLARSSGTSFPATGSGASTADHPGTFAFTCHASNANSGYSYATSPIFLITGGEQTTWIFQAATVSGEIMDVGFRDYFSTIPSNPTYGIWGHLSGSTLSGKTINGSGNAATGSTYTVSAGVWYRLNVTVNSDATIATFTLYLCSTGAQVWQDTISTHIPVGQLVGCGIGGIITSPSGAVDAGYVDYGDYLIDRILVR